MNRVRVSSLIQTTNNRFHFYFQSLPLSCFLSTLTKSEIFFRVGSVAETRHLSEPYYM